MKTLWFKTWTVALIILTVVVPTYAYASESEQSSIQAQQVQQIEQALNSLKGLDIGSELCLDESGNGKSVETYILSENVKLQVVLTDVSETNRESQAVNSIQRASNGETLWKEYGNRYFTAKAMLTISGRTAATFYLENHYKVSAQGLDENYGKAEMSGEKCTGEAFGPYVTTESARKAGNSEIGMYARYGVKLSSGTEYYTLSTSVGYVEKDSANSKIKVKHSWNLK